MVRRLKKQSFGRKSTAQKVLKAFRGLPEHERAEVLESFFEAGRKGDGIEPGAQFDLDDGADLATQFNVTATLETFLGEFHNAPGLGSISREVMEAEEFYAPGGPPMSPVHDSFMMGRNHFDLRSSAGQTVADIVLELADALRLRPAVVEALQRMRGCRLGLYRVLRQDEPTCGESPRYYVRELVTKRELWFQCLESYDVRPGELLLLRLYELALERARARGVSHASLGTPYVLDGEPDPVWEDYLQRAAAELKLSLDANSYERCMRSVHAPRRWCDYLLDGYAHPRDKNVVVLVGIPDLPHTLPHHEGFDAKLQFAVPRGASDAERLRLLSRRASAALDGATQLMTDEERAHLAEIFDEVERVGGSPDGVASLLMPVLYFHGGPTGLPPMVDRGGLNDDDPELEAFVAAAKQATINVYEVLEVVLDEGLRLRALLGGEELFVEERSATRYLHERELICTRVIQLGTSRQLDGVFGSVLHPRMREQLGPVFDALGISTSASGFTAVEIHRFAPAWAELDAIRSHQRRASMPDPSQIRTSDGELVQPTTAIYGFDRSRRDAVVEGVGRLRGLVELGGEPGKLVFGVESRGGVSEGSITVSDATLTIETLSREREVRIIRRIKAKVPGLLELIDKQRVDVAEAIGRHAPTVKEAPTPDHLEVVGAFMRQRYEGFLDESIPALGGLTPREAAKSKATRADLDRLLRDHEHGVAMQLGPGVIDFAAMRRELGLGD